VRYRYFFFRIRVTLTAKTLRIRAAETRVEARGSYEAIPGERVSRTSSEADPPALRTISEPRPPKVRVESAPKLVTRVAPSSARPCALRSPTGEVVGRNKR